MKKRIFITLIVLAIGSRMFVSRAQSVTQQNIESPTVLLAVAPSYGPLARSSHASGEVLVDVAVNSEGIVTSAKAISGHVVLRAISENTARRWRFSPSLTAKTERTARLTFVYNLMPSGTPYYEITPAVFSMPYRIEVTNILPEDTPLPASKRKRR